MGRKKSQGMAADVRNGDVRSFQGFFNGMKGAAMAASRAELGRSAGNGSRVRTADDRCGLDQLMPGPGQRCLYFIRCILSHPVLGIHFPDNSNRYGFIKGKGLDILFQNIIQLLNDPDFRMGFQKMADNLSGKRIDHSQFQDIGFIRNIRQYIHHG